MDRIIEQRFLKIESDLLKVTSVSIALFGCVNALKERFPHDKWLADEVSDLNRRLVDLVKSVSGENVT